MYFHLAKNESAPLLIPNANLSGLTALRLCLGRLCPGVCLKYGTGGENVLVWCLVSRRGSFDRWDCYLAVAGNM